MSRVTQFMYTNTSDSQNEVTLKALGLTSNYATIDEDATNAVLSNVTAPIDAEELVTFRTRRINDMRHGLNIQNPAKVKGAVQYQVQVESTLVTTDSTDPTFRVDEPVVALLTIRHPRSGNITSGHIEGVIKRLISCLVKADGTWRIQDMVRGMERPVTD